MGLAGPIRPHLPSVDVGIMSVSLPDVAPGPWRKLGELLDVAGVLRARWSAMGLAVRGVAGPQGQTELMHIGALRGIARLMTPGTGEGMSRSARAAPPALPSAFHVEQAFPVCPRHPDIP